MSEATVRTGKRSSERPSRRPTLDRLRSSATLAVGLFAVLPVLIVWSYNLDDEIRIVDVGQTLALCLAGSFTVYLLLRLLFRSPAQAATGTVLIQILVFSFGHFINVSDVSPGQREEGILLLGFVVLGMAGLIVVGRRASEGTVRILNLVGVVLLAMNVLPIGREGSVSGSQLSAALEADAFSPTPSLAGEPRDVYYLIFDRYAGAETLEQLYGFSNDEFLDGLRDRGFVVIDDALANYPQTTHSLASSLNMTYLDDLAEAAGEGSEDWDPLFRSLHHTTVSRLFQDMGYEYDHIGSWWGGTFADPTADKNFLFDEVRDFPDTFWRTTAIPALATRIGMMHEEDAFQRLYRRVQFQADAIREVSEDPDPTFTFAHFLLPHYPFVFDRNGNFHIPSDDTTVEDAYVEQLRFTNSLIEDLVDHLQAGTDEVDPIIVVQSDEGPHPPEHELGETLTVPWSTQPVTELGRKLRILNAIFLPGVGDDVLYPTMTPVNTFRVVFNSYYGTDLPMLDDTTYVFVDHDHPFKFIEVGPALREES